MEILIITSLLSPYRVDWFEELGKRNQVLVLYSMDGEKSRDADWFNTQYKYITTKKLKTTMFKRHYINFSFIKYLISNNFDVIIFDGYSSFINIIGIIFMNIRRKKFYINVDGGIKKEKENKYIRKLKEYMLSNGAKVLCSSTTAKEYVMSYGINVDNVYIHPFTSLRNNNILDKPICTEQKNMIRKKLGIREKKVVVSVGRFIEVKGFEHLIESSQNLSEDVGVYIIGGEPTKKYIELKEKYNSKRLHFIGFKNQKELFEYYRAADLFVLNSLGDVWGLVINEAMSQGLPVITTDKCIAGIELVKNEENGYIIPVNSIEELSSKMNKILNNEKKQNEMAKNSLRKIKDYSIENMAKIHINIFKKNIKGEKNAT